MPCREKIRRNFYKNQTQKTNFYSQLPPIGHAAHVRFKDMCRGFETNFCHKKQSVTLPPPEGREAKAYLRNGFDAGFCHFLGTIKIWIKKNIFCVEKYVNSFN
jgi:hypothetical protein